MHSFTVTCTVCPKLFILFQFQEKFSRLFHIKVFLLLSRFGYFVQSIVWSLRCCVKQNDSLEGFFWFEKMKYRIDEWNTNFNAFLCCCLSKCSNSACTHMRALFQCTLYAVNIRHKSVGKSISNRANNYDYHINLHN